MSGVIAVSHWRTPDGDVVEYIERIDHDAEQKWVARVVGDDMIERTTIPQGFDPEAEGWERVYQEVSASRGP